MIFTRVPKIWSRKNTKGEVCEVETKDHIVDQIIGIQIATCDTFSSRLCYAEETENDYIIVTDTYEDDAYDRFMSIVKEFYPCLCEFGYKYEGIVNVRPIE